MPAPPKPPTSLSSTVTIGDNASLTGTYPITLGNNTVVHPRARLNSTFAPIKVGNGSIIGDRSLIGLQSVPAEDEQEGVVIDNGVVVEVGAVVEAKWVGEGSVIEVNARLGKGVVIGKV